MAVTASVIKLSSLWYLVTTDYRMSHNNRPIASVTLNATSYAEHPVVGISGRLGDTEGERGKERERSNRGREREKA